MSFIEIGYTDEDSPDIVPADKNDQPDDLIPATEDEIPDVVESVKDE